MGKVFLPPTRMDQRLIKELDELVERFGYHSRSDLIREAIGDKIEELRGREIVQLRNIPKDKARREIVEYLKGKDRVYAADLAEDLRLDLGFVFDMVKELFEAGQIEEV
jgi:Arc/MetJ-type ribon-helix-helix transcriptional regulator